jgi:sensor domain CHASE-containing protein
MRMSLRLKVFLVVGAVLALLLLLVNQSLSRIIGNDFAGLERQEARNNAARAIDALQNRVDQLSIKLGDWAQWDDTYRYMTDHNAD